MTHRQWAVGAAAVGLFIAGIFTALRDDAHPEPGSTASGRSATPAGDALPPAPPPLPPQYELRPSQTVPLPRLAAILRREGRPQRAVFVGDDGQPRTFGVGDGLPGTDARIVAIGASSVTVDRALGREDMPVEPHRPSAATDAETEQGSVDIYARCEGLQGQPLGKCFDAQDELLSTLQDACSRYEEDDDQWQACMEAADRLEPYPG